MTQKRSATRADDERILALLHWGAEGYRLSGIEAHLGLAKNTTTVVIRRILAGDIKFSNEGEAEVRRGYGALSARRVGK